MTAIDRRLFLAGAAALMAPAPAFATHLTPKASWQRPPLPLANLRTLTVDPRLRVNKAVGTSAEDLLIVFPAGTVTGAFQLDIQGFRAVYCIGADVRIQPWGTLRSPSGSKVAGIGAFFKISGARNVVVEHVAYRPAPRLPQWPTESIFGDFIQTGGPLTAPTDVWRSWLLVGPFLGWGGYYGTKGDGFNTFSQNVSHADFIKPEFGGVRKLYTQNIEVDWGFQCEFASRPSYATNYVMHPDAAAYFRRYSARMIGRPDIGTTSKPVSFWLADSTALIQQGAFCTVTFGEEVFVKALGLFGDAFKPARGFYCGPVLSADGRHVTWPAKAPDGRQLAKGLVWDAAKVPPPVFCSEADVGPAWRVSTRQGLLDYLRASA